MKSGIRRDLCKDGHLPRLRFSRCIYIKQRRLVAGSAYYCSSELPLIRETVSVLFDSRPGFVCLQGDNGILELVHLLLQIRDPLIRGQRINSKTFPVLDSLPSKREALETHAVLMLCHDGINIREDIFLVELPGERARPRVVFKHLEQISHDTLIQRNHVLHQL